MDGVTFSAVLLLITFFIYKLFKVRNSTGGTTVPGPKGYPLVGSGLELTLDNIFDKFFEYAENHGDIYRVQIFQTTYVVLNTQELIQKALCSDKYKNNFNNRPWYFLGERFFDRGHSIIFYLNPKEHAHGEMRKAFARGLHVYGDGIAKFEQNVKAEIDRLVDKINGYHGDEFDVVALLRTSLSNLISILLIGEPADEKDMESIWELIWGEDFFASNMTNSVLGAFPFLVNVPGYYKTKFDQFLKVKARLVERYVSRMKATRKTGVTRGIVDWFLEKQQIDLDKGREPFMTDVRIVNLALEMMAAGIATTWSTLSSVMLLLVNHKNYQKKIQEEIKKTGDLSIADRHNCPFTEAFLLESQRYLTPSPLLGTHVCAADVNFEGFFIKAGTTVIPNGWYVHHDKNVWGDPWVFRPERFLDDQGDIVPNTHVYRKNWMPFSVGRRQCPGESLARSRLFLYVGNLLKRFDFVPSETRCGTSDPRYGEFDRNILLRPKPFYCRVVKRDGNHQKEQ